MFISIYSIIQNKHKKFIKLKLVLVLITVFTKITAYTQWLNNPDDHICLGEWFTTFPSTDTWLQKDFNIQIEQQKFDIKNNKILGSNFSLIGRGLILDAHTTTLTYSKDKKFWELQGDVHLQTQDIFVEAESLSFDQQLMQIEASDIHFILLEHQLHGYAKKISGSPDHLELEDVVYTQCPPNLDIWSIKSPYILIDKKKNTLIIKHPTLDAYGQTFFKGPTIKIVRNKVTNKMVALPAFKFSTQGSLAIRAPFLYNFEDQSLEITPEINFKYGLGVQGKIFKNNSIIHGFSQLPLHNEEWSWFTNFKSEQHLHDFDYSVQGSFISDHELIYRYPDLTPDQDDDQLYTINRGSLRKKTSLGQVHLYLEKLYRYKEAQQPDFRVIENLASARLDYYQPTYSYQVHGDLFHHINHGAYPRFLAKIQSYEPVLFPVSITYLDYLNNDYRQIKATTALNTKKISPRKNVDVWIQQIGNVHYEESQSPKLDVIARPLTIDSLDTAKWHQGEDWSTHGFQLGPRISLSHHNCQLLAAINYAIAKPAQPWSSSTQPYLTPFHKDNENNFSPLGVKLNIGDKIAFSGMYDVESEKFVYSELDYFYEGIKGQGYASLIYHHYFPMDYLSESTEKVAQFNLGLYSHFGQPQQYFLETGINLIPVKLERIRFGWKYDHCCWESSLGFGASKKFDPQTLTEKWNYTVSVKAEVRALGFMRLGRDKNLQYLGVEWKNFQPNNPLYSIY